MFPDRCWHTLITTKDYAEGVVCLAQSLYLVGSKYPVVCWVTDDDIACKLAELIEKPGVPPLKLFTNCIASENSTKPRQLPEFTSNDMFLDACRKTLWSLRRDFIFLDADLLGGFHVCMLVGFGPQC